ncbi:cytochrome C oxidase subunit II [Gracilibacillus sp. S3-1-1]|uniref:Cytochrome C oxidase subunit II n=1 Tax=Gracilibacillus pellucidus TaxID=3095368 RepID=A0ACC6M9E6_9BACI|nr:cytochrome C oxidase subunit II [Gracilibacillus sp. S3-1-1]MDX8047456.1 cytochrome C oxidase subunit II [Gracilibacillus sp. S3-1-1]
MKRLIFLMTTVTLAVVLTACGENKEKASAEVEPEQATEDSEVVEVKAYNWEFDQEEYTVPAGDVTVTLINEEGYHGIEVEGTNIVLSDEGSATANLEPGEYTIKCSIPCGVGHHDMVATLVVG